MDKDLERKLRSDMDPAEVDEIVNRHYQELEQNEEFVPIDTLRPIDTLSFSEADKQKPARHYETLDEMTNNIFEIIQMKLKI